MAAINKLKVAAVAGAVGMVGGLVWTFLADSLLVPFWSDSTYQRDEPTNPPWFVVNNAQPSHLYHNGAYVSQETGTNDLNLLAAWTIQPSGAMVGVVDMTDHGVRVDALVKTVSPQSPIHHHELIRWYAGDVAAGISNCVDAGCRVIVVATGFSMPDAALSNACIYAALSNVVLCCAAPDVDGDLDGDLVDYPYAWGMPNVLEVSSTDRNGLHYSPSGTGINAVGVPGRNIVASGTYSSGTSWATPIAAGCAALLIQRFPGQSCAAYVCDLQNTAQGPARRMNIVAALIAPIPTLSIQPGLLTVNGMAGWRYSVQQSPDLVCWQDYATVTGQCSLCIPVGFYRAKVL